VRVRQPLSRSAGSSDGNGRRREKPFRDREFRRPGLPRADAGAHYPRMPLTRTRKRAAFIAAAGMAFAASAPGVAAAGETALRIRLETATGIYSGQPSSIAIYGQAPANCAPRIERVDVEGVDMSVTLHASRTGCDAAQSIPFRLRVDTVAMAGTSLLPGQVYRLRVYSDAEGTRALAAFRLVDTGLSARTEPENGFWWSQASADAGPASRSTGISLESQGDQIAISLYGFTDSGSATWYFGSARLQGRTAVVPLLELANGDPLFSPTGSEPTAQPGPRLEIEFLAPTRARAWLIRQHDGVDTAVRMLSLSRTRFATGDVSASWNGRWIFVTDDEDASRQFEFSTPTRQDADAFHLVDGHGNASLDCRGSGAGALPDLCTLSVGAEVLADFDRIGLDRLVGRQGNGSGARLIRVSPP
jgi:hypothetical protein